MSILKSVAGLRKYNTQVSVRRSVFFSDFQFPLLAVLKNIHRHLLAFIFLLLGVFWGAGAYGAFVFFLPSRIYL